jgi:hypothetical protein
MENKMWVLNFFLQLSSKIYPILRRIKRDTVTNVTCEVPVFLTDYIEA